MAHVKAPSSTSWKEAALVWVVSWSVQLLLMGPCLNGRFFCDDWEFLLADPCRMIGQAFFVPSPYDLYRPLQLLAVAASQCWLGSGTLPIHLLVALFHAATCVIVWRITQAWVGSRLAAWLAVALLTVSQLSITAVAGNDTLSLVMGTGAGVLAFWLVSRGSSHSVVPSLAVLVIALLSKESSIGYSMGLIGWGVWRAADPRTRAAGVLTATGALVLTAVYLLWRGHVTGWTPGLDPNPGFQFGPQVVTHLAMLLLPVFLPSSTTWTFLTVQAGHRLLPALAVLASVACWLIVLRSAVRQVGARRSAALLALSVSGLIAVLPLRHVSELYAYAALPGLAILFGVAMFGLLARHDRRRLLIGLALVVWLAGQAFFAREKAGQMYANGESAAALARGLRTAAATWPHGSKVVMVDDVDPRAQYSLFRMAGVRLLPPEEVGRVVGRADISAVFAPASCVVGADTAVVLLGFARGQVRSRTLAPVSADTLTLGEFKALALGP
jgi:hypothetical protein